MFKAKILVVGPCESGKTVISNCLADQTEFGNSEYRPTQGVRILEFEAKNIPVKGSGATVDVELWDCSGDHKFEGCWAALARDTNGIIFVFNPDQPNQDKSLEAWFSYFAAGSTKLKDKQCLLMTRSDAEPQSIRERLPPVFSKINLVKSNIEEDAEGLKQEFNKFISSVVSTMSEKNEQDELNIMNNR